MQTIGETITLLLGTSSFISISSSNPSFPLLPFWPPDVFAVAATLVERSGCYAAQEVAAGPFDVDEIKKLAKAWRRTIATGKAPPQKITSYWRELKRNQKTKLWRTRVKFQPWHRAALALMALADEVCSGVGFAPSSLDKVSADGQIVTFVFNELQQERLHSRGINPSVLPYLPTSICQLVPPEQVCVQPKSRTPEIGCNIRTLTHHLALLPPAGIVRVSWEPPITFNHKKTIKSEHANRQKSLTRSPLRLLAVPFPFSIGATSLTRVPKRGTPRDRFFQLTPSWLPQNTWAPKNSRNTAFSKRLVSFLSNLVTEAELDGWNIDGIILPELALPVLLAENVARNLARKHRHLEFLLAGTFDLGNRRNQASLFLLNEGALEASLHCPSSEQSGRFEAAANGGFGASGLSV